MTLLRGNLSCVLDVLYFLAFLMPLVVDFVFGVDCSTIIEGLGHDLSDQSRKSLTSPRQ
jgi:hypothetical protein